jgi:thymidylate kinase
MESSTIIQDGGILFRSSYFLDNSKPFDTDKINSFISYYLSIVPYHPDQIFWVQTKPETALFRIKNRTNSVIPYFLRECNDDVEMLSKLYFLDNYFKVLLSRPEFSSRIVLIEN